MVNQSKITEFIFLKIAYYDQYFDLPKSFISNRLPDLYYVFLHRLHTDKESIEQIILTLSDESFIYITNNLMHYYDSTKDYLSLNRIKRLIHVKLESQLDLKLRNISEILCISQFIDYEHIRIEKNQWKFHVKDLLNLTHLRKEDHLLLHLLLSVWLQDLNWPGSKEVFEYLLEVPTKCYIHFISVFLQALKDYEIHDIEWVSNVVLNMKQRPDIMITPEDMVEIYEHIEQRSMDIIYLLERIIR